MMTPAVQPQFSASCCTFAGTPKKALETVSERAQNTVRNAYEGIQERIAPLRQGLKLNVLA